MSHSPAANGISPTGDQRAPRRPSRIAFCGAGELFGGVERHVLDLCTYTRDRGADPLLALFFEGELSKRARAENICTMVLPGRHRYDPRVARQLAAILAERRTHVLHVHGYRASVVGALTKRHLLRSSRSNGQRTRLAVIKTEHGLLEPAAGRPLDWLKMRANRGLDIVATRLSADAVCYVTAELLNRYRFAHRGLSTCVINNGIRPLDASQFPRPSEFDTAHFNLGIVGRVTSVKGISVALRALAASTGASLSAVRLNIIGTGPSAPSLEEESSELGIRERVRFLGFRPNVYDYMAHLDALVMPSLHEGLPYTLLEAMSLGLPIVASRVGGLSEVLDDGETAMLVPPGDTEKLAQAILTIVTDRGRARNLGARAAKVQRERYTLETMGRKYWQAYARHFGESRSGEHRSGDAGAA